MSLINDALKKAARQRAEDQAEAAPPAQMAARKRIPRRGAPMTVKTLMVLAGAALALIVVSVVMTGIFISGKIEPKPAEVAKLLPVTPGPQPAPLVVIKMPVIPMVAVPQPTVAPPPAAPVAVEFPSPTPAPVVPAVAVQAAPANAGKPALVVPAASHGDQVQEFVDRLRVTGVRTAGAEGKALVDGHVYRVNDILDRRWGVKLVQVDADHLTLVDSVGVTYKKSF